MEKEIKKGDQIEDLQTREIHIVLDVQENGYLLVQLEPIKRAGLEGGKNIIHSSEVDGVYLKKL